MQGTEHNDHIVVGYTPALSGKTLNIQVTVEDLSTGAILKKTFNLGDVSKVVVHGYDGDDVIENKTSKPSEMYGDFGNDTLSGGSGADKLYAASSPGGPETGTTNTLNGNGGNDFLYGSEKDDSLHGGAGADYLYGYQGNDELWGDDGEDLLYGNYTSGGADGRNIIHGGAGIDYILGADNVDALYGEAGDDVIHGQGGADIIQGGDGNDKIYGEGGDDNIWGGTITKGTEYPDQSPNSGNDTIYGGDGSDLMYGGDGRDHLYGEAGNDYLYCEDGNDVLAGGADWDAVWDSKTGNTIYFDLLDTVKSGDTFFFGETNYWFSPKSVTDPFKGYATYTD